MVECDEQQSVLIRRAVDIGKELVRICDSLDQEVAGNHITCGLDILAAAAEVASVRERVQARSSH